MMRFERSIPTAYFEDMYAADPDPWRFVASPYERAKYEATLDALPQTRYARALEVGCSIGVLTRQLAGRCDELVAIDAAEAALGEARRRCADLGHVRFEAMYVPQDWPADRYGLIVLSEIVYYLDRADVDRLAARVGDAIATGGDIVLVHWLGETHYPLTGDEAAEAFIRCIATSAVSLRCSARTEDYRIDVLRATGGSGAASR